MRHVVIITILFYTSIMSAQEIYIVNNVTQLKKINLSDFSVTDLFTIGFTVSDLAFTSNEVLYGITPSGEIVEIDILNESTISIGNFPPDDNYTALYATFDNKLISSKTAFQELFSYDLDDASITMIADGIATPGDITYYKGNIVYPDFDTQFIRAYNNTEFINIGCSVNQLYTFVNVFDDCQNETIYGIDSLGRIYNYDILNQSFSEVASVGSETGNVFGGATKTEFMASICSLETLNEINCSLSTLDVGNSIFQIYPNPVTSILHVRSNNTYNEYNIKITDISGKTVFFDKISNERILLDSIQPGMYFVFIIDAKGKVVQVEKLIKV